VNLSETHTFHKKEETTEVEENGEEKTKATEVEATAQEKGIPEPHTETLP